MQRSVAGPDARLKQGRTRTDAVLINKLAAMRITAVHARQRSEIAGNVEEGHVPSRPRAIE